MADKRIFVVGEAADGFVINLSGLTIHRTPAVEPPAVTPARRELPALQRRPAPAVHTAVPPEPKPKPIPTFVVNTPTMTLPAPNPKVRDAALLREITTNAVGNALAALKADKPVDAATALREALGFADRLVTINAALLTANALQANEFHGYDINDPLVGGGTDSNDGFGGYDLNNP